MEVSIDKISLIYTVKDKDHFNTIMFYMHVYKDEWKGKGKHYWKTKYSTKVKYKLDKECDLLIVAGITHGNLFVRFEFNVSQLSYEGWQEFYSAFTLMFEDGYKTAYENFRINYLEIAVDFMDVEFNKIYAIDNKVKQFDGTYKSVGSIYYGAKNSKRGFIIYDKAKQLKEVKNKTLGYQLLRVESRLRIPQIKLVDVASINNPFLSLSIFDVSKMPSTVFGPLWKKYQNMIQIEGLDAQHAYLLFNPIERQALALRIFLCSYEWWNPKIAWELAKKQFATLTPPNNIYKV